MAYSSNALVYYQPCNKKLQLDVEQLHCASFISVLTYKTSLGLFSTRGKFNYLSTIGNVMGT